MRTAVFSDNAPRPAGTYSPGVIAGDTLYLSGQGPFDASGQRVGQTFADQVRQTFTNLEAVAQAAGVTLAATVRYGVYLKNLDDFAEFNEIASEFLPEPLPARTTIEAPLRGFDVEIDAVLYLGTAS